jgi:uncharacterized protein (PEP-CTERM system associated)
VRNTVTLAAAVIDSAPVDSGVATLDDFARSSEIRQRSLSAIWAYQLSGFSTMNVLASQVRSSAGSGAAVSSTESAARVLFSQQIGARTFGTLGARYVRFDGTGSSFREKAITASVVVTF